jgi:hypothetical protein
MEMKNKKMKQKQKRKTKNEKQETKNQDADSHSSHWLLWTITSSGHGLGDTSCAFTYKPPPYTHSTRHYTLHK